MTPSSRGLCHWERGLWIALNLEAPSSRLVGQEQDSESHEPGVGPQGEEGWLCPGPIPKEEAGEGLQLFLERAPPWAPTPDLPLTAESWCSCVLGTTESHTLNKSRHLSPDAIPESIQPESLNHCAARRKAGLSTSACWGVQRRRFQNKSLCLDLEMIPPSKLDAFLMFRVR